MLHVTGRVRRLAASLVVGTLLLSGCGGDGDGADPTESPPAASDDNGAAADNDGDAEAADNAATDAEDAGDDADSADGADATDVGDAAADDGGASDDGEEAAPADDAALAATLEDLAPPGVVALGGIVGGTLYTSDAPFDDLVAHYEAVVGEANFVNEEEVAAVWVGEVEGTNISVNLSRGEDGTFDVLVAERP